MGSGLRDPSEDDGSDSGGDSGNDPIDDEVAAYVLRKYPQYSLQHIYCLGFREGGLTYSQFMCLHEMAVKADIEAIELQAAIHDKSTGKSSSKEADSLYKTKESKFVNCIPGDIDTYGHLTQEEREEWTQLLMTKYKQNFN